MRHWRVEFACPATPPCTWANRKWRASTHSDFYFGAIWLLLYLLLDFSNHLREILFAGHFCLQRIQLCFASNSTVKWELKWDYFIWGSGGGSDVDCGIWGMRQFRGRWLGWASSFWEDISGSTLLRWGTPTRLAFLTPPSRRLAFSVTLLSTLPSSSWQSRNRRRPSSISCPGMIPLPPGRHGAGLQSAHH